jgi:chorismate-pyruvate lyase
MARGIQRALGACLTLPFLAGAASTDGAAPAWRDDATARLEALALLQTLNADLLSHDSATLTLDRWCDAHHLASPAHIVAERDANVDKPPTAEQRGQLQVSAVEPVRYRRVRLRCGDYVLSEADNWYVPSRLTPDMNRELDTTDIAFGRAVQALHFQRHTLSATLLWWPVPPGWETSAPLPDTDPAPDTDANTLQVPLKVLEHRAMLTLPDGTPFSLVVETYTGNVLAFPEPPRR